MTEIHRPPNPLNPDWRLAQRLAELEAKIGIVERNNWNQGWIKVESFANSWKDFGEGYPTVAYMKDANNFVHLRGAISSGAVGAWAFVLPPGYRTGAPAIFAVASKENFGEVYTDQTGVVTPYSPSNNTWVLLFGITFLAEA